LVQLFLDDHGPVGAIEVRGAIHISVTSAVDTVDTVDTTRTNFTIAVNAASL
jgi:hypothetical protein